MDKIEGLRRIVSEGQHAKVDGVAVDVTTAHAILTVHDALNEVNRARYASFPVDHMASMAWSLVGKS